MKKLFVLLTGIFFLINNLNAQDTSLYTRHVFVKDNDSLPYRLLLPVNFDADKKYPLILFLHGSGERGNDNQKQLAHGGDLIFGGQYQKTISCNCSVSAVFSPKFMDKPVIPF